MKSDTRAIFTASRLASEAGDLLVELESLLQPTIEALPDLLAQVADTIRGWDMTNGVPRFILRGHFGDVRSVALCDDRIVSGSVDGRLGVWEPWSRRLIASNKVCGGEIWSVLMVDRALAAVLCDRGHIHVTETQAGETLATIDLPRGYNMRLSHGSAGKVLVGGEGFLCEFDIVKRRFTTSSVPLNFVRAAVRERAGYLMGGSFGELFWADTSLVNFVKVALDTPDYLSDILALGAGRALVSDAGGRVFSLRRTRGVWSWTGKNAVLFSDKKLSAERADFRSAKGLSMERRRRLADAGAII